jgi:beta-galactosidase
VLSSLIDGKPGFKSFTAKKTCLKIFVSKYRRRKVFLLVYVLSLVHFGQAQLITRLDNNWDFLKQDLGGVWEAVRPLTKTGPENVPVWEKVSLPHCYNAEDAVDEVPNYYQGAAWYRTNLTINNPYKNGRTLLHFEGSGQKTEVYVYTKKAGSHVGGYDEFTIDITDAVEDFKKSEAYTNQFTKKVPVIIRVDNSRDLEMIPSNLSDFMIYGGIYRYLNLVYVPSVSIDKVFASTSVDDKTNKAEVSVKARLYSPSYITNAHVTTKLFDPSGKLVQQSAKKISSIIGDVDLANFPVNKVQRWSPELPSLYTVEVTVKHGADSVVHKEKIGFRTFEFLSKGPFNLNGKRLLLRGTHRHEDAAGVGAALTEDMMRKEMLLIKEMGANFIRLGHYQQSKTILNLCDSLGLLVWEEIPWCRGGIGGEVYKQQARRMLSNMIEQHYNHPSVIIWGLGNENDWLGDQTDVDKGKIKDFMKELNDLSHRLDPSRKTAIRRCDFCSDIVDVYSPSIWMGWYKGIFTEYKTESQKEFENVNSFLHVEWGGDSHAGRHSEKIASLLQELIKAKSTSTFNDSSFAQFAKTSKDGDWSETYICNLFDWHLKEQETMPWLAGTAFWTFKDFATPLRPENPVPYVNQKGVVERDGTLKESYYVVQSYWSAKPMVHIYGHSFARWGNAGEEKLVQVYSNCNEAELFVNGKSYGIKKRNSQDFPAAGLRWNVVFGEGKNSIKVVAWKSKVQVVDEVEINYQSKKWKQPVKFVLQKIKEQDGVTTIQATLVDAFGVPCLDAMNTIKFGITGTGNLIKNQGTSTGSSPVQLYNGKAIININTNKGKNVVSVSAAGLPTAFMEVGSYENSVL